MSRCAAGCLLGPFGAMGKSLGRAKDAVCAINSFPSDTLVHTKPAWGTTQDAQLANASLKPISQLQVGDEVLALSDWKDKGDNPKLDKRLSYEKITDIYTSHKPQTLVHLTLKNGETLTATEGHPFKTTEGWRDAILLKKGGKLLLKGSGEASDAERTATIVDIRTEQKTLPVINLEVANAHTYFVGKDGEVVHNAIPGGCNKIPGVYRFVADSGKEYIGKAKDLASRLRQHELSGKLPLNTTPNVTRMPGSSDLERRIAEQAQMNAAGGPKSMGGPLDNLINSIAPSKQAGFGVNP